MSDDTVLTPLLKMLRLAFACLALCGDCPCASFVGAVAAPEVAAAPAIVDNGASADAVLIPCCIASASNNTYTLEYIDDSGAGRTICSAKALADQGVPMTLVNKCLATPSQTLSFNTGGGTRGAQKSMGMTSSLMGHRECYNLKDSPFAVSMGETVEHRGMPFIWLPGQMPFHVTDASKLSVKCPMKYRKMADRVMHNVPMFKEEVTLTPFNETEAVTSYPLMPARSGPAPPVLQADAPDSGTAASSSAADPVMPEHIGATPRESPVARPLPPPDMSVPEVPLDDEDDPPGPDDLVGVRSMSEAALHAEAKSLKHQVSHFPHNPTFVRFAGEQT